MIDQTQVKSPNCCPYCGDPVGAVALERKGCCFYCFVCADSVWVVFDAIRRFVRRCEVEALRDVVGEFMRTPDHGWSASEYGEVNRRAYEALARLAALAVEGT